MVSFLPLNITDEESLDHCLITIDHTIQYGEDLEVKGADEYDDEGGNGQKHRISADKLFVHVLLLTCRLHLEDVSLRAPVQAVRTGTA